MRIPWTGAAMALEKVTVSLPAELVREARHLAVDRGVSLSKFLALLLEEQVEATRQYRQARDRQLELLERGLPLGTRGETAWSRGELHER
jgi:hypothetical protein